VAYSFSIKFIAQLYLFTKYFAGTFVAYNLSDDKVNNMTTYLMDLYKTSSCWTHTYGTVDFLNYLKLQRQFISQSGSKLKIGVISNFDSRLDVLLRNMKLHQYFDFVLCSYHAGFEKPEKEIFQKAMKMSELQNLKPEECLHIGNTPVTDYFGCKNAGWYGLLVHEKSPEELKKKYGEKIEEHHVYQNLQYLHKDVSNDYIKW
jgi:HAD superfamily hydrolase (TIGR01549 family)